MKVQPWQEKILVDIESGGIKPGEMYVMMAGRNVGKSTFSSAAFKRLWDDIYKERQIEDLVLSEAKVHGARYYTVEPVGGNWSAMTDWCTSTFGEAAEVWDIKSTDEQFIWPETGRWYKNNRKFWFRNERDRDWFIIKWRS